MKLGVLACLFSDRSLEDAVKTMKEMGIETAEMGAGGATGDALCKAKELLADEKKLEEYKAVFKKYDMEISAIDSHVNPVHPDAEVAALYNETLENAILIAEKLGVKNVVCFSGTPELDRTALAPGVRRSLKVAVGRSAHPLLEEESSFCCRA